VLLAGGTARRAGVDKRYLVLNGRTLLQRGLLFLRTIFPVVGVSLRPGHTVDAGDLGPVDIVYDEWSGGSPLAGIASALSHYQRPIFVMATDIAFPEAPAVARLLSAYPGSDVALPVVEGHHEPLFAAYGPACLDSMAELLERGHPRILDLLPHVRVARVPFADARQFHNVNTMAAYATARGMQEERHPNPGTVKQVADSRVGPALLAIVSRRLDDRSMLIERLLQELARLGLRAASVEDRGAPSRATMATDSQPLDLMLVSSHQRTSLQCIEVFRPAADDEPPLCEPQRVLALIADVPLEHPARFTLDDHASLAVFIASRLQILRDS
jgi:molybdopterin-guanine dinucleotide biosynthesis protein A